MDLNSFLKDLSTQTLSIYLRHNDNNQKISSSLILHLLHADLTGLAHRQKVGNFRNLEALQLLLLKADDAVGVEM